MVLVDMLLSIRSGKAGSDRGLKKRSVEERRLAISSRACLRAFSKEVQEQRWMSNGRVESGVSREK